MGAGAVGDRAEALAVRFPGLDAWERGERRPTLKQLEDFAKTTHAPIGYFFLPAPPVERMPIPDFRTVAGRPVERPSPDLLDTIHLCQQRQEWYREFAQSLSERPLAAVGSVTVTTESFARRSRSVTPSALIWTSAGASRRGLMLCGRYERRLYEEEEFP